MDQKQLMQLLEYIPESGVFVWRVRTSARAKAGSVAGCLNDKGYITIRFEGRAYYAHRLAWLYMTGEWPKKFIDHLNMVPSDNRWENLREATFAESNANRRSRSKSGIKGVEAKYGRWVARAKSKYIGTFDTAEEAQEAYRAFALARDGAFFNGDSRRWEEGK